jgi:O-antigen ligase
MAGLLSLPILLKWHHPMLVFGWNASINVFFLPGQPNMWMVLALISFSLAVLNRTMDRQFAFVHVPVVTWSLVFLAAVVLVTAKLTGGISLRMFGGQGSFGGKGYFYVLLAIIGYFAISSQRIPVHRAPLYVGLFFLSGIASAFGNLAYALGPGFYFLFYLFPTDVVGHQVAADYSVGGEVIERFTGLMYGAIAVLTFMVMRYGIRGILNLSKPMRLACFAGIFFAGLFGGFRSAIIMFGILFIVQFYLEGLFRTRLFFTLLAGFAITCAVLIPVANKLPLSVQRSLSFLPLDLNPVAKSDAENSLEWRLDMWRVLLPEVPKHLFLGKGFALDATDLYMSVHSARRGYLKSFEGAMISGNYHNGPLSLIIPFGIWGPMAFLWFIIAGWWVLWRNYRYGDPALRNVNTLLLSYFVARALFFLFFFGAFSNEFYHFTGVLALSISVNGGASKEPNSAPSVPAGDAPLLTPRVAV